MSQTFASLIAEKSRILEAAGIDQGPAEVQLILCHLLGIGRLELVLHGMEKMTPELLSRFDQIIAERCALYPKRSS